ncbi:MAG: DEAD/DEAH box helicase [Bacteroidota bacterium]
MNTFEGIGLKEGIVAAVKDLGFVEPTPIQAQAIPHLINSHQDLIASAQTGTGKTAAFGLPTIHHIAIDNRATQALVLCPTRELCLQITKDLKSYAKNEKGLAIVAVYGGSSIEAQIKALKKGAQIVVATPGRAVDLLNRRKLILDQVQRLVLDEADEMLSMGFKEDLDLLFNATSSDRQILLFSATMSRRIKQITKEYMNDAFEISAARVNMGADTVEHHCYMAHSKNRYMVLKRVVDLNPDIYGIVFCRTRMETKDVAKKLMKDGYNADALHGDLSQAQRDEVMSRFRSKHLQMLIATDVASRGLDVDDLTHVINYNLPDDIEAYVHRSGRTGRAGKKGISIALINTREKRRIRDIEKASKITFEQKQIPTGKEICTRQLYNMIDKIHQIEVDEQQIEPFLPAIYEKLESIDRETLIRKFVSVEFNRFLEYYKDAEDLNVSDSRERRKKERKSRGDRDSNFARMFINIGTKNKLTPPRLIGVINEALDSSTAEIGKIDLMRNFSFFDIDANFTDALIKGVNGMTFEGIPISMEVSKNKPTSNFRANGPKKHKKKSRNKGKGKSKKRPWTE